MPDMSEVEHGISSFSLSWVIMLTLMRKGVISKEDVLLSLELVRSNGPSPVLDELKEMIENIGKPRSPSDKISE